MRKHDVRKWLHAILDLLPVILIPIFMIYSHRHDVTENVQVNYKYQSNELNTIDDLVEGNIYFCDDLFLESYNDTSFQITLYKFSSTNLNDFSTDDYDFSDFNSSSCNLLINYNRGYIDWFLLNIGESYLAYSMSSIDDFHFYDVIFCVNSGLSGFIEYCHSYGYSSSEILYTDYNVIESVDVDNTNVMDSFMNKFNNTIDTHFNMGNVFNLTGVYDWFNNNIFNGNAPQIIYSVWNIALYELVMNLLFLLYGLFMWFIDMIQKLMEKPLNSVK